MNLHKIYAIVIVVVVVFALILGTVAVSHFKDDARRDAVIDAQKSGIAELAQRISESKAEAQARISELEKQKQTVVQQPQQAPQIIRELIPTSQPIQQTAPLTREMAPDAPSAILTKQQEIELAQFATGCKQCSVERDQLKQQVADQTGIIDKQKIELAAAMKTAKGGSVWKRTVRIVKWTAIAAGVGYVMGRVQR